MNHTQLDRLPQDTTLAVALHVVTHWPGAKVLPVDGKHPVYTEVPHGSTDASDDPAQIAAWFAGTSYGVGVTGILAIDGDNPDLTFDAFGDCLTSGVQIQGNPERITFLFAQPDDPFGDGKHPGGEVKGSGYVVLPPSAHVSTECASCSKGPHDYVWLSDWATLPSIPADIETTLAGMVRRQAERTKPLDSMPDGWLSKGDPCPAVLRHVDPLILSLATPGVAKYPHVQAPLLALLRLGEQGHAGVLIAADRLRTAYIEACQAESSARGRMAPSEFARSLLGAAGRIHDEGLTDPYDLGCCPAEADPSVDDRVFKSSAVMEHIRLWAQASRVGPWALLGSAMARAVAEVPPHVRLPAYVGGDASLNMFVALVDSSGAGKSAGHKAADAAFMGWEYARAVPNGTGEGLIASFMQRTPKGDLEADPHLPKYRVHENPQVLMYVDEIGQLQVGASRSGSSIEPILRSMWNGEHVGTNNADPDRNRNLPPHAYRLAMVAGVQPGLAGSLLNSQATVSGTAQRWLWLPVSDPFTPDVRPDLPVARTWELTIPPGGVRYIGFPDYVRTEVDAARLKVLRGVAVTEADKVKAHAMLCRMKVAAALAVLHGELDVDDRLWAVAGEVMEKSDATRAVVLHVLSEQASAEAEGRGRAQFTTEQGRQRAAAEAAQRVAKRLTKVVVAHTEDNARHDKAAGCTRSCLANAVASRDRGSLDDGIAYALEVDVLRVVGDRFRLGPMGSA